nr:MAG TPA: winged helix storkhead-box1 domain protein [Caudoviricetes sp.]
MNIIYDRVEVVFRASGSVFDCRQICETIMAHKEFYSHYNEAFKENVVGTRSGTAEDAKRVFYDTIGALTKEGKRVAYYV